MRQKVARGHMIDFVSRSLAWRIALAGQAGGCNPGLAAYGKLFVDVLGDFVTDKVRRRVGFILESLEVARQFLGHGIHHKRGLSRGDGCQPERQRQTEHDGAGQISA